MQDLLNHSQNAPNMERVTELRVPNLSLNKPKSKAATSCITVPTVKIRPSSSSESVLSSSLRRLAGAQSCKPVDETSKYCRNCDGKEEEEKRSCFVFRLGDTLSHSLYQLHCRRRADNARKASNYLQRQRLPPMMRIIVRRFHSQRLTVMVIFSCTHLFSNFTLLFSSSAFRISPNSPLI